MLWALICTVNLTVFFYHLTYAFQSKYTLYNCFNVKELLAWSRSNIWSLANSNRTRTHNYLDGKRLNHLVKLAKWLSCVVSNYLYGVSDCIYLRCHLTVYSKQNSIISSVWLNCCVSICKLSGCRSQSNLFFSTFFGYCSGYKVGFESCWSHLNFKYGASFEQEVSGHLRNYRVWIHSKTRMWHNKNIHTVKIISFIIKAEIQFSKFNLN